jgi:hypothetical protein
VSIAAALNEIPRPALIVGTVLGFVFYWPVGLAVLAYLIGSGRIGCNYRGPGRWYNAPPNGVQPTGSGPGGPSGATWGNWGHWANWAGCQGQRRSPPPSGNTAFDEYRTETLHRLEEEQREFQAYLERLRQAKDKAEFDQFMADRRRPTTPPEPA